MVGAFIGGFVVSEISAEPAVSTPVPGTLAASAPPTTDHLVCGDLERLGRGFYNGYYKTLMQSGGHGDAVPTELAAQTMALMLIGAPNGQTDGAAQISAASPAIRTPMIGMVRDATMVGKGAADASVSAAPIPDMTSLLTTFSQASVECTKAGYRPAWFNPAELTGH